MVADGGVARHGARGVTADLEDSVMNRNQFSAPFNLLLWGAALLALWIVWRFAIHL